MGFITTISLRCHLQTLNMATLYLKSIHFYSATALLAMQIAVLAMASPSIRLSVRLLHAGTLPSRIKIGSPGLDYEVAKTL